MAALPVWALVDEQAHYDYVQSLAEDQRIPDVRTDLSSPEAREINDGPDEGLAGRNYEAFQPPLYYLVAAPVFAAGGDHLAKVYILRTLGVVLLMAAVWLLWLLARRVAPDAPEGVFAFAACSLLVPGVAVRIVTVSNAGLEVVLALAAVLALWRAHAERDARSLVAAGALVGAALLTRLTVVDLVPVLAIVAAGFARRQPAFAALALVLPALLLAPWLVGNLDRYGSPTAWAEVRDMQEPVINPTGRDYGAGDLDRKAAGLLNGVLPEEWWVEFLDTGKRRLRDAYWLLFLAVPLGLALGLPREVRARAWLVLGLPATVGLAVMTWSLLAENWDAFYPRYLYAVLPGLFLLAALGLRHALRSEKALAICAGAHVAVLLGIWLRMAMVTPYTS